jgi:hypothetical protein
VLGVTGEKDAGFEAMRTMATPDGTSIGANTDGCAMAKMFRFCSDGSMCHYTHNTLNALWCQIIIEIAK